MSGVNGSGMHVHQSLFKNGRNVFFDANDEYHLSAEGKSYIADILKHCPEFTCVTNQWVNSYKRLVPGYEAPVYVAWARKNRSTLVRVPMYKPGKEGATRMELRSPDPAANPYLCFAVMLEAGLKGIDEGYKLPSPIEENVFAMDPPTLEEHGITALPGNLYEAAVAMKKSELVKECLGDHIHSNLYKNKIKEWDAYRTQVTEYELNTYLPVL
jgi:glutamine synthetase